MNTHPEDPGQAASPDAPWYIHGRCAAVAQAHAGRTVANSARHLAPHLRPGLSVLDIGSAGGALTRDLAAYVAPGQVTGLDSSPDAVRDAQVHPARPANLTFEVGDAYALPFEPGSFDVVHFHQVLHHLTDPAAALREAARVVRPGGLIAVREADFGASFWFPEATAWEAWRELYQLVARAGGTEVDAGRRLAFWLKQADLGQFADLNGSIWTYPGFAPVAQIAGSWADRLVSEHFSALAVKAGAADRTALIATAKGLIEWGNRPDAFFAMPHIEALVRLP
ncbi:MAG: class I SAM-dependent methyltransferase [Bifidobacteriaceae bacterium]|jgi:ubiquinone/menaquinone biosynthesis C-methylase UbiE|nr:class I SAM-dependent methyltransferase [Bifidobacteriaceae bacterium]